MATTITIPSLTDPDKLYLVTLDGLGSCTCPDFQHRRKDTGTACKHLVQARKERSEKLALIAGSLEDAELERLLLKYRDVSGKGEVVLALLAEQWDRWQLAQAPAPAPAPRYEVVLANARAWGRAQRDARYRAIFA